VFVSSAFRQVLGGTVSSLRNGVWQMLGIVYLRVLTCDRVYEMLLLSLMIILGKDSFGREDTGHNLPNRICSSVVKGRGTISQWNRNELVIVRECGYFEMIFNRRNSIAVIRPANSPNHHIASEFLIGSDILRLSEKRVFKTCLCLSLKRRTHHRGLIWTSSTTHIR
jgi:hypothetical protein